ncbi:uncharacterized protein LOC108916179 [Anoplophora glabripennis]|uniref:uncharacterized protein LOC108916179 n=1 Tax=Anoplophora glabripennis TaxID=217634 RepID=UPI000874BDE1|nr:uncharacterized protein LOC108916179 [Anoplophora glabripennis]
MFGGKLRSWMEAVRPRKKQHRKDKPAKSNNVSISGCEAKNGKPERSDNAIILPNDFRENDRREVIASTASKKQDNPQSGSSGVSNSRYSANNLSSPESAYSTGYSTDGTSPGAPPEYLLNNPSRHSDRYNLQGPVLNSVQLPNSPRSRNENSCTVVLKNSAQLVSNHINGPRTPILQNGDHGESKVAAQIEDIIGGPKSPSLGITSPRQRNRIRTNPWLPSNVPSPVPAKHEISKTTTPSKINRDSPRSRRFLSPVVSRRHSLSSSSCSSLSGTSLSLEPPRPRSASDDEDCTLNEMMGKYDESYVYEKETDILSDSDPTDCETDIDTGQDGGDEDDPFEGELDFIDNGSHLEYDPRLDHNTGHCSYYNFDVPRKRSSRRRTTRRSSKQASEKKRRSSSNKKHHVKQFEGERLTKGILDGSKSAGATPLSARRAGHRPVSKLALEECLKKRSNSVSFYRNQINTIDKRDKEADLKYKELIIEAEQILRTMKTNGLSPRRIPGPANKRVELLRNTECSKIDVFSKTRNGFTEDSVTENTLFPKVPSNTSYNCSRFSPKKSHITNFLISNSPVLVRKEWDNQSELLKQHLSNRKKKDEGVHAHKGILVEEKNVDVIRVSPRHKRHANKRVENSSSDSDDELEKPSRNSALDCPQSEPVRRKVYFANTTINAHKPQRKGKTVVFNLKKEVNDYMQSKGCRTSSTENLRQQVLLNTIVNLKRNLEDQSASLRQVYRSSHNIYV